MNTIQCHCCKQTKAALDDPYQGVKGVSLNKWTRTFDLIATKIAKTRDAEKLDALFGEIEEDFEKRYDEVRGQRFPLFSEKAFN